MTAIAYGDSGKALPMIPYRTKGSLARFLQRSGSLVVHQVEMVVKATAAAKRSWPTTRADGFQNRPSKGSTTFSRSYVESLTSSPSTAVAQPEECSYDTDNRTPESHEIVQSQRIAGGNSTI